MNVMTKLNIVNNRIKYFQIATFVLSYFIGYVNFTGEL